MAPKSPPPSTAKQRDFLTHLEAYLARRDGVDKLLKICRYATKILLSSSAPALPLTHRLNSFEASLAVSRNALRLGKFLQPLNALTSSHFHSTQHLILATAAHAGEGFYFFLDQFVWLAKAGLIDERHSTRLHKVSAWAEFIGYVGSVWLKLRDLNRMGEEEACLGMSIEVAAARGDGRGEEEERMRELQAEKLMRKLSIAQDVADGLMALAGIRDGDGRLSGSLFVSSAGLLSALISTHKNWMSC